MSRSIAERLELLLRLEEDEVDERLAILHQRVDGQLPDDAPERADEDLLDGRLDLVLLADEPFRGGPDLGRLAADLEDRGRVHPDPDALGGHAVVEVDRRWIGLERQPERPVDDRDDDRAGADHDPDPVIGQGGDLAGLLADLRAASARDDQRLVRPGDLVAPRDVDDQEDDDDDDRERREDAATSEVEQTVEHRIASFRECGSGPAPAGVRSSVGCCRSGLGCRSGVRRRAVHRPRPSRGRASPVRRSTRTWP